MVNVFRKIMVNISRTVVVNVSRTLMVIYLENYKKQSHNPCGTNTDGIANVISACVQVTTVN
jgi:hypothetical protein